MDHYLRWLASLSEDELGDVLRRRGEVLAGPPARDLTELATRLRHPFAIAEVLPQQSLPALEALEALLALGGHPTFDRLSSLLEDSASSPAEHRSQVRHVLGELTAYGLAWLDDDTTAHTSSSSLKRVMGNPLGLGDSLRGVVEDVSRTRLRPVLKAWGLRPGSTKGADVEALDGAVSDPERVRSQAGRLSAPAREILEQAAWGAADEPHRSDQYVQWLTTRGAAFKEAADLGLLIEGWSAYEMRFPAEVALALRGEDFHAPFHPVPPVVITTPVSPDMVEREARAALTAFTDGALAVLDLVRNQPIKALKSGGIGAREVTRIAKATRVEQPVVRMTLDLALGQGLVEPDGGSWVCGGRWQAWRDAAPADRALAVFDAWLSCPWMPTQTHDDIAKALAVGDTGRACAACVHGRDGALHVWAGLQDDVGASDADVAALVRWRQPWVHLQHADGEAAEGMPVGRHGAQGTAAGPYDVEVAGAKTSVGAGPVGDESRMLGLVAHGSATRLLRQLASGDEEQVRELVRAMLPEASGTAAFGSDLTAVVAGPPTAGLSALLDLCADREGRGGAVTWRFSAASVRRALDAGTTREDLEERLTAAAASDALPQGLSYLLADVARRHGHLRVAPASCVIHCEDHPLLAEVVRDRSLAKLELRLVAANAITSRADAQTTLAALRGAGYFPMSDDPSSIEAGTQAGSGTQAATGTQAGTGTRGEFDGDAESDGDAEVDGDADGLDELDRELQDLLGLDDVRGRGHFTTAAEDAEVAARRLAGIVVAASGDAAESQVEAQIREQNRRLSDPEVRQLAFAIENQQDVVIEYRSSGGGITTRQIGSLTLIYRHLSAWCHLRRDERHFLLAEILAVSSV